MALSTYDDLWRSVLLRCPLAGPMLARQWVSYAFRSVAERRRWSWLVKRNQFILNQVVNAGTVSVTRLSPAVVGNATAAATWSAALIGRQFRVASLTPIYTITAVSTTVNPNDTLTLDEVWGGTTNFVMKR